MVSPWEIFLFTKVASTLTLIVCLLLLFLFLIRTKSTQKAISLLVTSAGLFYTVTVTKDYYHIARPIDSLVEASGYAFPSGHAAGIVFLAMVVSFLSCRLTTTYRYMIWATCILTASVISYSRIILHVHTWFQVLVGICFGTFFGFLFIYLSNHKKLPAVWADVRTFITGTHLRN